MSRLGVPLQHPGSRTIIKSEGDKLLGRGTINWSCRTGGGLNHRPPDGGGQEQGDKSISENPAEFTGCIVCHVHIDPITTSTPVCHLKSITWETNGLRNHPGMTTGSRKLLNVQICLEPRRYQPVNALVTTPRLW